ncbi:hypothetical protein VTP01DRAFT_3149 [Rhizomucor pusillus]|uniref:uncharacterized protein n=1 Tax=Rhizomucor pusillus TaxID=4840 RepID=UPI0037447B2D
MPLTSPHLNVNARVSVAPRFCGLPRCSLARSPSQHSMVTGQPGPLQVIGCLINRCPCCRTAFALWDSVQQHVARRNNRPLPHIKDLEVQLTIIAPCNSKLSTLKMSMIKQEQNAQLSLASLKRFPAAHKFLLDIFRIENYTEWEPYSWRHSVDTTSSYLEQMFIKAIRFILTAFADKCHRHQN